MLSLRRHVTRDQRTDDAWRPAPRNAVAVALLREMFALVAASVRRSGHPVGR